MRKIIFLGLATGLVSSSVLAAGYEKSSMWSGKYAAIASAASSSVNDAESLYFNPAGLGMIQNGSLAINLSPTYSQFSGPVATNSNTMSGGNTVESNAQMTYIPSVIYGHKLNDKLAVAGGVYASAGTKSIYEGVQFAGFVHHPEVGADVQLVEYSLGLGYNLSEKLRVGASWRMADVKAGFASASVNSTGAALVAVKITGMEDKAYDGFSVGMQYGELNDRFGAGIGYKSRIKFSGEGDQTGSATLAAGGAVPGSTFAPRATLASELPEKFLLGGHFKITEDLTLFGQYEWTHYSRVKQISIDTNVVVAGAPVATDVITDWQDQNVYRLALQQKCGEYAYSVGSAYVTQVTNDNAARSTFTPPNSTYSVNVGAGKKNVFKNADFNLALERAWGTDHVAVGSGASNPGKYTVIGYAAHLGMSYNF